jgi:hypothetical protein
MLQVNVAGGKRARSLLTRSPDFNARYSRIAFGIVAWPLAVIADSIQADSEENELLAFSSGCYDDQVDATLAPAAKPRCFLLAMRVRAGVPAVCDAPERIFDWKRIECIGIVLACPFFDVSMA